MGFNCEVGNGCVGGVFDVVVDVLCLLLFPEFVLFMECLEWLVFVEMGDELPVGCGCEVLYFFFSLY